jgi:hypothetical protein
MFEFFVISSLHEAHFFHNTKQNNTTQNKTSKKIVVDFFSLLLTTVKSIYSVSINQNMLSVVPTLPIIIRAHTAQLQKRSESVVGQGEDQSTRGHDRQSIAKQSDGVPRDDRFCS